MSATADAYAWISLPSSALGEAYCVTLVRGLRAEQLLDGFNVDSRWPCEGADELDTVSYQETHGMVVGATPLEGWAMAVELNGFLGTRECFIGPLSRGTRLVSVFCNVNMVTSFNWYEDGEQRLVFDPFSPEMRYGTTPHALNGAMRYAGFDPGDDNADPDEDPDEHERPYAPAHSAFALAEHLTGIHLSNESIQDAAYLYGASPHGTVPSARGE